METPAKEPTLLEKVVELENQYVKADAAAVEMMRAQFDILRRLAPLQHMYLKSVIDEKQKQIDELTEALKKTEITPSDEVLTCTTAGVKRASNI